MASFISLLRGINVTGHNMIKMTDLKALCESIGFKDVATYIQSGNVVFRTQEDDSARIELSIEQAIEKKFGFPVTVIVRKPAELARAIRGNPFVGGIKIEEVRLYVTFLRTKPTTALVKALQPAAARSADQYKVLGREVYLYCPNGYGKTLLSNAFFEKQLKSVATTRNWKTVNILYDMASRLGK